ncbi:hypothetical protein OG594_45400 [Streptomyces sp. NBC_01214]|uniref:hypothetical protein n=1 Tax=Streptomyces sp. NBC_01214 TaxID=2903777 RepID=UPI0022528BAC|nr:hypothetical protein [Streptomyces sp. NBC_01214]MCX4808721.1 hypothetical protein [Streptomyces sp. NBC_01214]
MALETWEHDGDHYCLQSTYVQGDEAWYFELSESRSAPADRTASPCRNGFLPGPAAVTVIAHDSKVEKPPYVHFDGNQQLPFDVLEHFTTMVATKLANDDTQPPISD